MISKYQAKTFGDWATIALAKHFSKMLKHEVGVLEDQNPEDLHQMRVGIRRLRTAIVSFDCALNLPKKVTQQKLGKLARILGTLRDIDVLQEALKNQYQPVLPPSEQIEFNQALKILSKKRQQAFKQVQIILGDNFYKKLKQELEDWLKQPSYQTIGKLSINQVLPDLLLPQVSKLLLHPGWLLGIEIETGEVNFSDIINSKEIEEILDRQGMIIHDLRKEAKRTRYQMELFTQFYGDKYEGYLKEIKSIQEILGQIQDCFVLAEFFQEVFKSDIEKNLPTLVNQLTTTRYQRWQEWEVLQRKFLNPQTKQDLRMTIMNYEL